MRSMSNHLSSFGTPPEDRSGKLEIWLMFVKGDIICGEDLAGQGVIAFITLLSVRNSQ